MSRKQKPWKIQESKEIAERAGIKALRLGAEKILSDATMNAPVDTGTLRRSGTVTVGSPPDHGQVYTDAQSGKDMGGAYPDPTGKEKMVYMSFNTPYARRQHEGLGFRHPLGGKAKYLEDSFNAFKAKVLRMAELAMKKALKEAGE